MVDFSKAPPPKEGKIINWTGPMTKEKMDRLLFTLLQEQMGPGALLKTEDYKPLAVDPILNIAHDPLMSGSQMKKRKKRRK